MCFHKFTLFRLMPQSGKMLEAYKPPAAGVIIFRYLFVGDCLLTWLDATPKVVYSFEDQQRQKNL